MQSIVVVEDEVITAMDIQGRLEDMGYHVPAVSMTGEEAIKLADELKPDLMLMDIMLKGKMDGTVAAEEITKKHQIPIVFLTAYNDRETFSRAKLSNPYAYLNKPFDTKELGNAIELALYKNEMISRVTNSEKRYRALMQYANLGIVVHDFDGNILEVNKACEKLFGIDNLEMIGKNIKTFIPNEELEYFNIKLNKLHIENAVEINIGHIMTTNGTVKDVEILSTYVNLDGENLLYSLINNVTEKNKLLSRSAFNEKLSTIGRLATGIVHEINNPLASMFLNLDMAADIINKRVAAGNNGETKELAVLNKQLNEGAERIRRIVSDLRDFGRKESEVELKNIHDIIETTINLAVPYIKNKAQVIKHYSNEIPDLWLNSGMIEQVLLNLLINSSQAFENPDDYNNNIIHIKTHIMNISLYIDVSDTGKGIPQHYLQYIFDPFFTTKPANIGTGLGLSISKQIIQSLSGEISVKSNVGIGTTFTIRLPIKIMNDHEQALPTNETGVVPKSILVVDDDAGSIEVIKRLLGEKNNITGVSSGKEALKIIQKSPNKYNVIIADVDMADIDGIDLHRYLSENVEHLAHNMIFISSNETPIYMKKFMKEVKNPFLKKPYTLQDLILAIKSLDV